MTGGFTLADKDTLTNEPGVGPLRVTVDTMIATLLRQAPTDARASVAAWRQISDILAPRGNQLADDVIRRSLQGLAVLRRDVPGQVRRSCAPAVARLGRFASRVASYSTTVPSVPVPLMPKAPLSHH